MNTTNNNPITILCMQHEHCNIDEHEALLAIFNSSVQYAAATQTDNINTTLTGHPSVREFTLQLTRKQVKGREQWEGECRNGDKECYIIATCRYSQQPPVTLAARAKRWRVRPFFYLCPTTPLLIFISHKRHCVGCVE